MRGGAGVVTSTILFTDLVGSTELRAAVGEVRADALRREHDELLKQAVGANGGRVVKWLGDGLMATFPSASAALGAATDVQRSFSRRNASAPARDRLGVRIGISAGDVSVEDDDCHGTPVVEAARLCAAAEGGQVLMAAVVRAVAGGRGAGIVVDRGSVPYKGLAEPVPTLELLWRDEDRRWPLPSALVRGDNEPLIGRDDELAALEAAWVQAADGRPRLAMVRGEPGIGKTTLVSELAESVGGRGALVLSGHCDAHVEIPYQPFADALRAYVAMVGPRADRLGDLPGELSRLVPELTDLVADLPAPMEAEPETQRYRLAEAVAAWLGAAASRAPTLLVLEDVHWADRGTVSLLHHIVGRTVTTGRLLVVATARDAEPGDTSSAELLTTADPVLALRGLETEGLEAWLRTAGDQELDADGRTFAASLRRDTGGNPLYVREILRHLVETGALRQADGRWTSEAASPDEIELPGSLREVLDQRLSHVREAPRRVLEAAAVLGRTFELPILREVAGTSPLDLADALDALSDAGLLTPADGESWTFTHALIRSAALDQMRATRRPALHLEAAEALERQLDPPLAEVARHWSEAAPLAGRERAEQAHVAAGESAATQLAFDAAVTHFEQALSFARDERRRCQLRLRLGELQHRAGDERFHDTLARVAAEATELGVPECLIGAALASGRPGIWYSSVGNVDLDLVQRYERAIAVVGEAASAERAKLLALLAQELYWSRQRDRRLALAVEALATARAVGEACVDAIIPPYVMAIWDPSTRAERLARVAEVEARSSGTGSLETRFHARYLRYICLHEAGDHEAASGELRLALELADELRYPVLRWRCLTRVAAMDLLRGPDAGEPAAMEALEVGQSSGQPDALSSFGAQYFVVCWDRGELGGLADTVAAFVDSMPGIPAWRAVLALLFVETDQLDLAREQVEATTGPDCLLPADSAWMVGTTLLGECAARLRYHDRCEKLYDLLLPYEGDVVDVVQGLACLGSVSRTLGLLAAALDRNEAADRHFTEALLLEERIGAACFSVRTRRDHATMLASGGAEQRRRAATLAQTALRDADALGMAADAERLRALGRRLEAAELLSDDATSPSSR